MASHGIKDQVAIVGMGCTSFGEHWDKSLDDLIIEASEKATKSAGLETDLIDAYSVSYTHLTLPTSDLV